MAGDLPMGQPPATPTEIAGEVAAIRLTIGFGLLIAALLYVAANLGLMQVGGNPMSLPVGQLLIVAFVFFVLGTLTNLVIASFAPKLILLSLLGLDRRAPFPIMMGSAAIIFATSGAKILRDCAPDMRLLAGVTLDGPMSSNPCPSKRFAGAWL